MAISAAQKDKALYQQAVRVGESLARQGSLLATAESCTGGWVAKVLTDVAGSSIWFDCGFVTYSNEAKKRMLGVRPQTLEIQGAVSEATVREMAEGALLRSRADMALAVSGIAGPGGGTPDKPVGTVCFAWSAKGGATLTARERFTGNRDAVRRWSVVFALEKLLELLHELP